MRVKGSPREHWQNSEYSDSVEKERAREPRRTEKTCFTVVEMKFRESRSEVREIIKDGAAMSRYRNKENDDDGEETHGAREASHVSLY